MRWGYSEVLESKCKHREMNQNLWLVDRVWPEPMPMCLLFQALYFRSKEAGLHSLQAQGSPSLFSVPSSLFFRSSWV